MPALVLTAIGDNKVLSQDKGPKQKTLIKPSQIFIVKGSSSKVIQANESYRV